MLTGGSLIICLVPKPHGPAMFFKRSRSIGNMQHANAKTTPRIRKDIQEPSEAITESDARLSLNPNINTPFFQNHSKKYL